MHEAKLIMYDCFDVMKINAHTFQILRSTATKQRFSNPFEEANKMISKVLLLVPSFTKKEVFKNLWNFFYDMQMAISPIVFSALYCKFKLVRLCWVLADLVTLYSTITSSQWMCLWVPMSVCPLCLVFPLSLSHLLLDAIKPYLGIIFPINTFLEQYNI